LAAAAAAAIERDMATDTATFSTGELISRVLSGAAVLAIALATIGSSWSVYQAARWNNISTDDQNASNAARIDAAKATTIATSTLVYDATLLSRAAAAAANGQPEVQQLIRDKLYRPAFLTLVDQAIAAAGGDPTAVPNLFANQAYINGLLAQPQQLQATAQTFADTASTAGNSSNAYTVIAVTFAAASFFAGTVPNLTVTLVRMGLLALTALLLVAGAARLGALPIA
jgi:hypothetical protein